MLRRNQFDHSIQDPHKHTVTQTQTGGLHTNKRQNIESISFSQSCKAVVEIRIILPNNGIVEALNPPLYVSI